jgi:hypothetical protein
VILELLQIGRIAFLKPAVREAVLFGPLVSSLHQVPRNINAQHVRPEPRRWQCRRPIPAAEIQNLEPFHDPESCDERLSALAHTRGNLREVAFLP